MMVMINANLGTARRKTGCNVPDQHVYKVMDSTSLVVMDCEGANGDFNRAQRAHANLGEVLPTFLVAFLMVGYVFPWITAECWLKAFWTGCYSQWAPWLP